MDDLIAAGLASGKLKPRPGYNSNVTVRHVPPMPVTTSTRKKKPAGASSSGVYPGFQPKERVCRRDGCDNTFLPSAPANAYCTPECRAEAIRAQRRETDRAKRKRLRELRDEPFTRVCRLEGCDVEFEPRHFNERYCSPEHRAEATRIIKATSRAEREGKPPPRLPPTSATRQAIAHIEAAHRATNGHPVAADAAEYIAYLWGRVQEDPNSPPHIFEWLEHLLGLTCPGTTITAANGNG